MNTSELARFSDVVGLIYEGATDPSRWTKDILPALAEYIQTPISILLTPSVMPQDGGVLSIHGISQQQMELYASRYHAEDLHGQIVAAKGLISEGNVILDHDLLTREQLLESKYYKEYLVREDMTQLMTTVIFGADSMSGVPVTICSFWRGINDAVYTEQDRARLKLLVPHFSRSLGVMQRLRSAELTVATTLAALDRLPSGVLLIDAQGYVTFANRTAQRMLEDGEGLHLRKLPGAAGLGRLVAGNSSVCQAINTAIGATLSNDPYATPHFSKAVSVPQTSGLASYTLQFSALGNHHEYNTGSNAPAAIIFIADGRHRVEIDPAVLHSAYGLTPAEARVAVMLLECATLQDAADQLKVGEATVRSHVKQIYAKLGVDTRARFVKLMMGLAGGMA